MEQVKVIGDTLSEVEVNNYVSHIKQNNPHSEIKNIEIKVDGDFVDLNYVVAPIPFQRIRRVTGYLVGTLDRFNDGKRAEEKDRVKHI